MHNIKLKNYTTEYYAFVYANGDGLDCGKNNHSVPK